MSLLRWAAVGFLVAGIAAAPLNFLHARLFSGAELARVPLARTGPAGVAQSYPPLIVNLKPDQSPVAVFLEVDSLTAPSNGTADNRYVTHLISGSQIAAKAETIFRLGNGTSQGESHTLLRAQINGAGVYSILLSEAAAPAVPDLKGYLTVRANTRRADMINILAGIAFMLIGTVTLFATGKRRQPSATRPSRHPT